MVAIERSLSNDRYRPKLPDSESRPTASRFHLPMHATLRLHPAPSTPRLPSSHRRRAAAQPPSQRVGRLDRPRPARPALARRWRQPLRPPLSLANRGGRLRHVEVAEPRAGAVGRLRRVWAGAIANFGVGFAIPEWAWAPIPESARGHSRMANPTPEWARTSPNGGPRQSDLARSHRARRAVLRTAASGVQALLAGSGEMPRASSVCAQSITQARATVACPRARATPSVWPCGR